MASHSTFERTYTVQPPLSWSASTDKQQSLESSTNIVLPEDALQALIANDCQTPFTFKITDASNPLHKTYVGVQEFSAEPSNVIVPDHLLNTLQYPQQIHVKYVSLPLGTAIELYPNKSTFIQQPHHMQSIRQHLCAHPCISPSDTLNITLNHELHTLTVMNIEPSCDAVSLHNQINSIDIKLLDDTENESNNDDEDNEGDPPIASTITTTKGGDIDTTMGHTMGGGSDHDIDMEEEEWPDEDEDDDDDGWGDDEIMSSFDGQDLIPFTPPPVAHKPMQDDEELVPDPNSTADGNSRPLRPVRAKIEHRAWICEFCHAINNLLESMKRQYKCVSCEGKYRPGQALIESKEEDKPEVKKRQWQVWYCSKCSKLNAMGWKNCDICFTKQPMEGVVSFWIDEEPVATNKPNRLNSLIRNNAPPEDRAQGDILNSKLWQCVECGWMNEMRDSKCQGNVCKFRRAIKEDDKEDKRRRANKFRPNYQGNLSLMGSVKSRDEYPTQNTKAKVNKRLLNIFGAPYRNAYIAAPSALCNRWIKDNDVGHCVMNTNASNIDNVGAYSVALNEETGYIAMASLLRLFVFAPHGGYGMILKAQRANEDMTASAMHKTRVRFVADHIYVFHPDTFKIYVYAFDEKEACIKFVTKLFDSYFVDAQIKDFVVTKQVLIVLFDRWLGIYRLYPRLEWYHAVAFSQYNKTRSASIEMSIYDDAAEADDREEAEEEKQAVMDSEMKNKRSILHYAFINCENKIVAVHPSNPTFDFLYIADNVKNGASFCNSAQYGTFYINNEKDRIYQSSGCDAQSIKAVRMIASVEEKFEWKAFQMIPMHANDATGKSAKHIVHFDNVLYDERFGISGRLLVRCTILDAELRRASFFYQCLNWDELLPLQWELEKNEYCLMPGADTKPFNLIVFVFEMLYGSDIIDQYIESPAFNPVYAEEEEEEKEKADISDLEKEHASLNTLLSINSKCMISVNGRWHDGIVVREFTNVEDANRLYVEVSYGAANTSQCLWKYDVDHLKYNEAITMEEMEENGGVFPKHDWKRGDQCLYLMTDSIPSAWYPAEVISIDANEDPDCAPFIRIKYHNDAKGEWCQKSIVWTDSVPLYKLDDVMKGKERICGEEENEYVAVEAENDEDFVEIEAVQKGENDESADDDDMEIEEEGANDHSVINID